MFSRSKKDKPLALHEHDAPNDEVLRRPCGCPITQPINTDYAPTGHVDENTILEEDFECLKRVAQGICATLARPKDRELCRQTLDQLSKYIEVNNAEVRRDVNKFLRFYLRTLRWTQLHQPLHLYRQWYAAAAFGDSLVGAVGGLTIHQDEDDETVGEVRVWLEEQRAYMAMKSYANGSTIIYMAVAKNPLAGWQEGGMKSLARRRECGLNSHHHHGNCELFS